MSLRVCVIRWRWPFGCGGSPGSVTSIVSVCRRFSSSLASSASLRRSSTSSSVTLASLAALPVGPLSSGGNVAIDLSTPVSSDLRPRYFTRRSSSSCALVAWAIAASASLRSWSRRSDIGGPPSYLPQADGGRNSGIEGGRARLAHRNPRGDGRLGEDLRRQSPPLAADADCDRRLDRCCAEGLPRTRIERDRSARYRLETGTRRRPRENRPHARSHRLGPV